MAQVWALLEELLLVDDVVELVERMVELLLVVVEVLVVVERIGGQVQSLRQLWPSGHSSLSQSSSLPRSRMPSPQNDRWPVKCFFF